MLFIKAPQKFRQNPFYWDLRSKLDRSSTQAVSVENYQIRNFRSNYMHILMYLCRVSFLTTLDLYKDYFKGRCTSIVWLDAKNGLVHYSFCRSCCVFMPRVLWPRSFLFFIIDELKNFAVNNLLQVGVLVMYWDLCIIG